MNLQCMAAAPPGLSVASSMSSPSRRTLHRRRLRRQRTLITRDTLLSHCPPQSGSKSNERHLAGDLFTTAQLKFMRELFEKTLTAFGQVLCDEIESLSTRMNEMASAMHLYGPRVDKETNDGSIVRSGGCNSSVAGDFRALPLSAWTGIWERFTVRNSSPECCTSSDCTTALATVEDQIALAQLVAALVNSSDRGCMKTYHFRRDSFPEPPDDFPEPKMPPSAYMLYVQEQKALLHGDMHVIAKALQGSWKTLRSAERTIYIEKADKLRQQYEHDLRTYVHGVC